MVVLRPQVQDKTYQIRPEILAQLRQHPCCTSTLDDPAFTPILAAGRNPPAHKASAHSFVSKTLNTADTIPIWEQFYRAAAAPGSSEQHGPDDDDDVDENDYGEGRVLMLLAAGLDGHLDTAHGGLVAAVLDQALDSVVSVHATPGRAIFTAYLRVDYLKPVLTSRVVVVKARLDGARSNGRKIYVRGELESAEGVVCCTADAMFLEVDTKPSPRI